jgi:hypothetical protein
MEYKIVEGSWVHDLEKKVERLIKEGWVLKGGVAITKDEYDSDTFYQAMIKE